MYHVYYLDERENNLDLLKQTRPDTFLLRLLKKFVNSTTKQTQESHLLI